jgi:phosphoserine phosphatase RsbU/P
MLGATQIRQLERTFAKRAARVWVIATLFGVGFVAGMGYHFAIWAAQSPPSTLVAALYNVAIVGTYGLLLYALSEKISRYTRDPARIFWSLLLFAVLAFGMARLLMWLSDLFSPDILVEADIRGFELETGVPLTPATVVKMNLVAVLEMSFAFIVLILLRELVQFKRTRQSMRNWTLMIVLMVFTSLLTFLRSPQSDIGWVQGIALVPTVGFMVVNSFRLSWVVYLSFREKTTIIGQSLALLVLLAAGMATGGDEGFLPRAAVYLQHYSYPLASFSLLVLIFGILYSLTALLSLIFHLPTTSDFQKKAGEMAAMHSLTSLVSQVFDPERLNSSIVESPVDAGTAQATWLVVRDMRRGSLEPEVLATCNVPTSNAQSLVDLSSLYDEAYARSAPVLLEEAAADHRVDARPGDGIGSLLVVPLIARGTMLGALFAAREVARSFEKDDVEALAVFGAQAALALDNASLFEEKVEKERLERELSIAREVQTRLLPQAIPQLSGLSIEASSVSAQEVGGDYYDLIRLDDHRLAFIVADVSGKGTSAAFYMAEMQGIFHALAGITSSPTDFLSHANEALARSLERHVFISVIYGVLDTSREELVMARAGHCPAAVINLAGEARYVRSRGLGLGLDRSPHFRASIAEERRKLEPGDAFVFYTDGVIESRNESGDEYGYDRLLHSLKKHRHEDATVLHERLLGDLQSFIGHMEYDDDLTLLVFKWRGIELDIHSARARREASPSPTEMPATVSQS